MRFIDGGRHAAKTGNSVIVFPPFRFHLVEQQLWEGDRLIPVKPKALAVLQYLLTRPGRLITRDELLAHFWGEVHISDGVLKTQIGEIRQALGDCAREPRFIETARRRGYRFIGDIDRSATWATPDAAVASVRRETRACPPSQIAHFVGRAAELDFLMARWARARSGERQVVFISGEAGVGKTVLVSAFLDQLSSAEVSVWVTWGQCIDQYGSGEPYLPIVEALRRACAGAGGELIVECMRHHAPAWRVVMPMAPSDVVAGPDSMVVAAGSERLLGQLVDAIEAIVQQRPLVLLLEDLHWADPSTLALLACLMQRSDPARLLVVGTYRRLDAIAGHLEDVVLRAARGRCAELSLPHLSQRAVSQYLGSRFNNHRLPSALSDLIHRRTEGNALFMVGLIDGWLDQGLLKGSDGNWELTASLEELARCVPDSFVRMIERELERLGPFERSVLEAASVAGKEFSTATVAAALAEDVVRVEEICTRWAQRGQFLRNAGVTDWADGTLAERCEFIHVLYQQIIYDQIGAARQTQWHRRIGERLESGYATVANSNATELALHFQRGGDYGRGVRYLRISGERALRQSAYHEAIDHLTRALDLVGRLPSHTDTVEIELDLRVLIAPALRIVKGHAAPEVEHAYARVEQLCKGRSSTSELFVVMAGMGALYILRGESGVALELGEKFLGLANRNGNASAAAEAHVVMSIACHHLGRHRTARHHVERVTAFYEGEARFHPERVTSLDHGLGARCFVALSLCMLGYPDQARHDVEEALMGARALDNPFAIACGLTFSAHIHLLRGEPDLAEERADALATLCAEKGIHSFSAFAILLKGGAQSAREELVSGIEMLHRGWASLNATGSRVYAKCWAGLLANAHARMGELDNALQVVEGATSQRYPDGEQLWDAELLRIKGELLLATRSPDLAVAEASRAGESHLLRALELAKQQEARLFELRAAVSLSRHWSECGDRAEARALLTRVHGWFTEGLETSDVRAARALIAELH